MHRVFVTGATGRKIVLGGTGADTITTGTDDDVVLGDNGNATFNASGQLLTVQSTGTAWEGADDDGFFLFKIEKSISSLPMVLISLPNTSTSSSKPLT